MHSLESGRLKKFHYCKPGTLTPNQRHALTIKHIKDSAADLVLLQELDSASIGALEAGNPMLTRANISLNESLPSKDGVGIFVNLERFQILDSKTLRFSTVLDKHVPTLGQRARSDQSPISLTRALYREVREKMNLAVLVKLKDVVNQRELVACSSHLFWDPGYPDIKLIQAYLLGQEVLEYAGGLPAVVGADLNSVPHSSAVYELLMGSGTVAKSHAEHPVTFRSNPNNKLLEPVDSGAVPGLHLAGPSFVSAFQHLTGREPEFTNYTGKFKGCLDYVMTRNFEPISARPLPEESELASETALPNSRWPSDHLPLVVDLDYAS